MLQKALDSAILAWSLLNSAIVVLALRAGHALHRAAAAVLCMLVLFAEPLVLAVVGGHCGEGPRRQRRDAGGGRSGRVHEVP